MKTLSDFVANRPLRGLIAATWGAAGGFGLVVASGVLSPVIALVLLIGGLLCIPMLLFPEFAFLLTAFVVPIERLGRFGDDSSLRLVSLMRIVGTLALGSYLLHALVRRWKLRFDTAFLLCAAFVLVVASTYLHAYQPEAARAHGATVLGSALFLFLTINVVRDWRLARRALFAWLLSTTLIALFQVYDWHFGTAMVAAELGTVDKRLSTTWDSVSEAEIGAVRRATGTTSNAAVYGINLILTLPFWAFLWRTQKSTAVRLILLGIALVVLYNILLTNTRGVMLFGGIAMILMVLTRLVVLTPGRVAAALVVGATLLYLAPEALYRRALDPSMYTVEHSSNLRARFTLWGLALEVAQDYWLTGLGHTWEILPAYSQTDALDTDQIWSHNDYLQTLLDVGVFGWLFFYGFVATVLWYAFKSAAIFKRLGASELYWFSVASGLTTINVLLFALHVDVFHFPLKGWWLVAGLTCAVYRLALKEQKEAQLPASRLEPLPDSLRNQST